MTHQPPGKLIPYQKLDTPTTKNRQGCEVQPFSLGSCSPMSTAQPRPREKATWLSGSLASQKADTGVTSRISEILLQLQIIESFLPIKSLHSR